MLILISANHYIQSLKLVVNNGLIQINWFKITTETIRSSYDFRYICQHSTWWLTTTDWLHDKFLSAQMCCMGKILTILLQITKPANNFRSFQTLNILTKNYWNLYSNLYLVTLDHIHIWLFTDFETPGLPLGKKNVSCIAFIKVNFFLCVCVT